MGTQHEAALRSQAVGNTGGRKGNKSKRQQRKLEAGAVTTTMLH